MPAVEFEVTVPEPQTDPDLMRARSPCVKCALVNDSDARFCKKCGGALGETVTTPIVVRFFDYWVNLLQSPIWDADVSDGELVAVASSLRGRVSATTERFTLSKAEREALLTVGAKLPVDPPWRQVVRPHRLAILRARAVQSYHLAQ